MISFYRTIDNITFKNELFNVRYDLDNDNFSKHGDVSSFTVNNDYMPDYDMNKYHVPQLKRMSSAAEIDKRVNEMYLCLTQN